MHKGFNSRTQEATNKRLRDVGLTHPRAFEQAGRRSARMAAQSVTRGAGELQCGKRVGL
jgi:hypothetical protein